MMGYTSEAQHRPSYYLLVYVRRCDFLFVCTSGCVFRVWYPGVVTRDYTDTTQKTNPNILLLFDQFKLFLLREFILAHYY
jgi:hypothetical protein